MGDFVTRFLVAGGIMAVLDAVWLSVIANSFYKSQVGKLLLDKPNMPAAVVFYFIYVVGIVAFVLAPALEKGSWQHAVGYGALFGFCGVCDLRSDEPRDAQGLDDQTRNRRFAVGRIFDCGCGWAKFLAVAPWLMCSDN